LETTINKRIKDQAFITINKTMTLKFPFFFFLDEKETKNQEKVIGSRTSCQAPANFSGQRAPLN